MSHRRRPLRLQSEWTEKREEHLKAWVIQMTRTSVLMNKASSWLTRSHSLLTFFSHLCTSYTAVVPFADLGWSQVTAAFLSFFGIFLALLSSSWGLNVIAKDLSRAAMGVGKLARCIDLQLQQQDFARDPPDKFCSAIALEYDEFVETLSEVPRVFFRSTDLLNLTLLTAYLQPAAKQNEKTSEVVVSIDTHISDKLKYELSRFAAQNNNLTEL